MLKFSSATVNASLLLSIALAGERLWNVGLGGGGRGERGERGGRDGMKGGEREVGRGEEGKEGRMDNLHTCTDQQL